jgi:hypothetical protein
MRKVTKSVAIVHLTVKFSGPRLISTIGGAGPSKSKRLPFNTLVPQVTGGYFGERSALVPQEISLLGTGTWGMIYEL